MCCMGPGTSVPSTASGAKGSASRGGKVARNRGDKGEALPPLISLTSGTEGVMQLSAGARLGEKLQALASDAEARQVALASPLYLIQ